MKRNFLNLDADLPNWLRPYQSLLWESFQTISKPTASYLCLSQNALTWHDPELGPYQIESFEANKGPRILKGRNEILAKALRLKSKGQWVVDATVGSGKDTRFFLELGCKILGFEKDPLIFLLLQSALARSKWAGSGLIQILHLDAAKAIHELSLGSEFSVYIDPMFDVTTSSAKPKKAMQIFRGLGLQTDWQAIVQAALASQAQRVVLKQPLRSSPHPFRVLTSFKGKSICYQVLKT